MIIAVAMQKGGVGKTTTAVNLSAYLAKSGKSVLLIDVDPQGASTTSMGFNKWKLNKTLYDVLVDSDQLASVALITPIEGLHLIPSNLNLSGAEKDLADEPGRDQILKNKLASLTYDYIILDCPPSLGVLVVNALVAADVVLVPVQAEALALDGLGQLQIIISKLRDRLHCRMRIKYLLTMYSASANICKDIDQMMREKFGDDVLKIIIPRNVKLAEAPDIGKPICMCHPDSAGARAYKRLSEEVLSWNEKQ